VEEVIVEEEEIVKVSSNDAKLCCSDDRRVQTARRVTWSRCVQDGLTEEELAEKKKQMEEEREKARLAAEREWKKHNREMKMSELESQKVCHDCTWWSLLPRSAKVSVVQCAQALVCVMCHGDMQMEGDLQQTMSQAQEAERAKKMLKERLAEMQSQVRDR